MKKLVKKILPKPIIKFLKKIEYWEGLNPKRVNPEYTILNSKIVYNENGEYCIPRSSLHRPAVQTLLSGKVWEPDTIEFMIKNCGNGDIIHAGTFFGDFLPALSRNINSDSKVWAFEPVTENYRCADITVRLNGLNNVILENAGLGLKNETLYMRVKDSSGLPCGGGSSIVSSLEKLNSDLLEKVKIVSIDSIIPKSRNISIIQLDVEGYEKLALAGAIETITRCHPIIILENLPDEVWFSNEILSLGYTLTCRLHANYAFTYNGLPPKN